MGYDAWVEITHRPIDKKTWEEIEEKFGGVMPETWEYNEKTGQIDAEDRAHNPDLDTVREIATFIAKITEFPVQIYWDDDEGDYSEIVLPDGRYFAEVRLFQTDVGDVETYTEYVDRKMAKKVLDAIRDWKQLNGKVFHLTTHWGDTVEVVVRIDKDNGKVLFLTPEGEEIRLATVDKLKLWDMVLKEVEGGE